MIQPVPQTFRPGEQVIAVEIEYEAEVEVEIAGGRVFVKVLVRVFVKNDEWVVKIVPPP